MHYSLWTSGRDRFAVTPLGKASPILGYLCRKANKTWVAERAGVILPENYPSTHLTDTHEMKRVVANFGGTYIPPPLVIARAISGPRSAMSGIIRHHFLVWDNLSPWSRAETTQTTRNSLAGSR